jgi:hypothetical protein
VLAPALVAAEAVADQQVGPPAPVGEEGAEGGGHALAVGGSADRPELIRGTVADEAQDAQRPHAIQVEGEDHGDRAGGVAPGDHPQLAVPAEMAPPDGGPLRGGEDVPGGLGEAGPVSAGGVEAVEQLELQRFHASTIDSLGTRPNAAR